MPDFDVVGVGLNATDTLLVVSKFPAYGGKARVLEEIASPGGQVRSEEHTSEIAETVWAETRQIGRAHV